jgi:hypothetical protein
LGKSTSAITRSTPSKAKPSPNAVLADFLGVEPVEAPSLESVRDLPDDGRLADPRHTRQQQNAATQLFFAVLT